jgi:hypothetical protein
MTRRLLAAALVAGAAFTLLPVAPASACDQTRPDCNPPSEVVERYLCVVRAILAGEQPYPQCGSLS